MWPAKRRETLNANMVRDLLITAGVATPAPWRRLPPPQANTNETNMKS